LSKGKNLEGGANATGKEAKTISLSAKWAPKVSGRGKEASLGQSHPGRGKRERGKTVFAMKRVGTEPKKTTPGNAGTVVVRVEKGKNTG